MVMNVTIDDTAGLLSVSFSMSFLNPARSLLHAHSLLLPIRFPPGHDIICEFAALLECADLTDLGISQRCVVVRCPLVVLLWLEDTTK